jgi:hypothetical protein
MLKDGEHREMLAGLPARAPEVEDNPQAPARAGFLVKCGAVVLPFKDKSAALS